MELCNFFLKYTEKRVRSFWIYSFAYDEQLLAIFVFFDKPNQGIFSKPKCGAMSKN
jgi:hypothetical protein